MDLRVEALFLRTTDPEEEELRRFLACLLLLPAYLRTNERPRACLQEVN